ncbi:MAG: arginine--tRNA ligase [Chlamydiales bacterium]|nr:arginine--tRNA ligase [Chlamydiales bacterium]
MINLHLALTQEITKIIKLLFQKELSLEKEETFLADVTPSTQDKFGHYQCNSAMRLGKLLKSNPRDVATKIIAKMETIAFIAKTEVAGPGFINIFLASSFLCEKINQQLKDPRLGIASLPGHEKVVIDFSSPNVAKELHVGHLRSTIIGDSIARLLEFLGYDVLRLNHIGDWGTQFGMLITYLRHYHKAVFLGDDRANLSQLMLWYRESKKHFDADPVFKKQAQLSAVDLQQGNVECRKAWEIICEISRKAYQEIYHLLDIQLIERGESFYQPFIQDLMQDLHAKGLVTMSDGAECIFLDGFEGKDNQALPIILKKSDGGFNYATTDMAAIRHRSKVEKAKRLIYVVDSGQKLHLEMIFTAAEKAGYVDRKMQEVVHVAFGVVLGSDGKKYKTRSGETERLIDLIQEAIERSYELMKDRIPDASDEELMSAAKILGVDAVKYADLSGHRQKDYAFSYDRMLKFEGNTAAFLLYSYVRIQSIKRKADIALDALMHSASIQLETAQETDLALHLLRFSEALREMDKELLPNRLCDYLFTLAEKFNIFFRDCQVIGHELQHSRLLLADLTGRVLKQGLSLLGLKTLDRM